MSYLDLNCICKPWLQVELYASFKQKSIYTQGYPLTWDIFTSLERAPNAINLYWTVLLYLVLLQHEPWNLLSSLPDPCEKSDSVIAFLYYKMCLLGTRFWKPKLYLRSMRNKILKGKKREIFSSGYGLTVSSSIFTCIYSQHLSSLRCLKGKIKIINPLIHRGNKRSYFSKPTAKICRFV